MATAMVALAACGGGGGGGGGSSGGSGATTYLMGGAMQGIPLNLTPTTSNLAGAPRGSDGIGVAARFLFTTSNGVLNGLVSDGSNLYVADSDSQKIRKVVLATGVVSTLSAMNAPTGITTDGARLFVTDFNFIREIR